MHTASFCVFQWVFPNPIRYPTGADPEFPVGGEANPPGGANI